MVMLRPVKVNCLIPVELMRAGGYYFFFVYFISTNSSVTALVATLTRIQPSARWVNVHKIEHDN